MHRRRPTHAAIAAACAVLAVALPACSAETTKRDPAKPTLPQSFGDVDRAACDADRSTLETAIEAYRALNGDDAMPTEADLVTAGLLRTESSGFDIEPSGILTPSPAGPCQ